MRWTVVSYYTGLFLRIFSVLLLVPVAVGKYYGESFVTMEPFLLSAFVAIVLGWTFTHGGQNARPEAIEAMAIATCSWVLAVAIGAIPVYSIAQIPLIDAFFDSMAGFTTTGMVILETHALPRSLLFWRMFMQWIGGLGILTFFVMVLAESGSVASRLVSQEANKTESGVIRPSLFNAIKSMWYVYIVLTLLQALLLYYFDIPAFHAVGHALGTLPTGGFSTTGDFAAMMSGAGVRTVFTLFMFLGGTNFLLIYAVMNGNIRRMYKNYEFRLYVGVLALAFLAISVDLVLNAQDSIVSAVSTGLFHAASVLSSSGYELEPVGAFPTFSKLVFLFLMFVGGSLGSTTGGFKMLRFGVLLRVVKNHIRSLTLSPTVMNRVTIKGRILDDSELTEIASFFFLWVVVIFAGAAVTVWFSPHGIADSLQVMTSAVGTMGPTFITGDELRSLPAVVKLALSFGMLAGRLELLPILALLNRAAQRLR